MHLRVHGGTKHAAEHLTELVVERLVALSDHLYLPEFSLFAFVSWEFLLRCQSEAIPLCSGTAQDATFLHPDRHSGVWLDGNGTLCLRLQRRKNRPQGSLLMRPCVCATKAQMFCVVCRLKARLRLRTAPARLWEFTPDGALRQLRRLLQLLEVPRSQSYTLKAFRAGKATALATAGKSLGTILSAGEWRSAAFLSYVNEDAVDRAQILDATLAASDDDAEEVAPAAASTPQ